ncbi:MAG: histidine triad nucleotide-binding protein [Gemmatimonadota bacterium]|nr:histidine triad nucleotide-binding protein [Gemmatimonadota bacterium]
MSDSCLFCKIARNEIPAERVAETDRALVVRDIAPQAPVHLLVIPKEHLVSLVESCDVALFGELLLLAAESARNAGVATDGYRVVVNTGVNGGQSVPHLHLHVLGGRRLSWPPG